MDTRTPRGGSAGYAGVPYLAGVPAKTPPDACSGIWGRTGNRQRHSSGHPPPTPAYSVSGPPVNF